MSGVTGAAEAVAQEAAGARAPQPYKVEAVASLRQMLERTPDAVYADYTGLDVGAMAALRRSLAEQDATLRVVKNRFLRIALDALEMPTTDACLTGPTAVATLGREPNAACKVLVDARREWPLVIKGAMVDGQLLDPAQVEAFAALPSREQLYAMLLSAMNGPARSVAGVLQGVIRKLVGTVQAVGEQRAGAEQRTGAEPAGAGKPADADQEAVAQEADG